jgi:hypothetical protein
VIVRMRSLVVAAAAIALAASTALAVAAHDVTGRWAFAVVTENGTGTPTVTFKQAGESLTGTYESRMLGVRTLSGTVKGDSIRFALSNTASPDAVTLTFIGVLVDANAMKGIVDFGGMGGASFTATREKATP